MKSSLTLTTSRLVHHARLYCGELFVFLAVEFFDILRLKDSHMNAAGALLARVAPPPVLAELAATADLARCTGDAPGPAVLVFWICRY